MAIDVFASLILSTLINENSNYEHSWIDVWGAVGLLLISSADLLFHIIMILVHCFSYMGRLSCVERHSLKYVLTVRNSLVTANYNIHKRFKKILNLKKGSRDCNKK